MGNMKLDWRINGNAQLILVPENGRDKAILQLFAGGRAGVRFVHSPATAPEAVIIEAFDQEEKNATDIHERATAQA
jgi:hypothetical protein